MLVRSLSGRPDEFLSEEDLDLKNLSWDELMAWWDLWLREAQASNDRDAHRYGHGVFLAEPGFPEPRDLFL